MEIVSLHLNGYKYFKFADISDLEINLENKMQLIIGSNGSGKALRHGTPVKTPFGWTNIENLHVGDFVTAIDGSASKVVGVYPQGIKNIYRITFVDGRFVDTDEYHLWSILRFRCKKIRISKGKCYNKSYLKNEILDTSTIEKILKTKNNVIRSLFIPFISSDITPDILLPVDPYTLGVLLGDGSLYKSGIYIHSDLEVINKVQDINFDHLRMTINKGSNNVDYFYDARLRQDLDGSFPIRDGLYQLGLIGTHSYDKFIPEIYFNASYKQRLALLQGLMDTDGTVSDPEKTSGRNGEHSFCGLASYSTTSPQLAKDFQRLVWSLGGQCKCKIRHTFYTKDGQRHPGKTSYWLCPRIKYPEDLCTLTRKKVRLSNKNQYCKNMKLRITSVEKLNEQDYCTCIAIDHPSKLYVTKDYIVTHNSSLMKSYSPAVPLSTNFDKHGYKELVIKHNDHLYTLEYDAGSKSHIFRIDDGPNINESGTSQVQEELIVQYLGYTKLIEKLIYNKMKMTQMTPAARMDFLISINPINIKFMKDKYAKLLSQYKKYKAQLELLQTRASEYKSTMMDEIEFSKYLTDKEKIEQFDNQVVKYIYRYDTLANQCKTDMSVFKRDIEEYKFIYKNFKHFILKMSNNNAKDWIIPTNMSISEMTMTRSNLDHNLHEKLLQMSSISKEIDELESMISKSSNVDITALEKQFEDYKKTLMKYTNIDWSNKVIVDWPPQSDIDPKYQSIHKLHELITDCNEYYNNTRIWHIKTFQFHKRRNLTIHSRVQDISRKIQYTQQNILDIEKQIQTHNCNTPDKNCVSTTCPFKVRYTCILDDLKKKHIEAKKSLILLDKEYAKWKRIGSVILEMINYQSTFVDEQGILSLMYETIMNISPLFTRVFPNVDTLVNIVNVNIDQIFTIVKNVLQDSNDYHEKCLLENKIKELELTIAAHKKDMSLVFATKKIKEDYENITKLEKDINEIKSLIEAYDRYIEYQTNLSKAMIHTESVLHDLDSDLENYTKLAKHTAYKSIVEQLNELHAHLSKILRDMDTVITNQKRVRELYKNETSSISILEKDMKDIQTICQVLDPYTGLPAKYTKYHLSKILQNVNYFISKVFTYPLTVSLQEDAKDMKYKFMVQADTVPVGDISNCSDGQMEMIDLAFTLAIMIALGIHNTHPIFLDEIGRCLDINHAQRLLELLLNLVNEGYIHQLFIINHQAVMIGGFDKADVVCLNTENIVLPEKYNTTVTMH